MVPSKIVRLSAVTINEGHIYILRGESLMNNTFKMWSRDQDRSQVRQH